MEPATVFHADLAEGPEGGRAWSVEAADGVLLRVATWPGGTRGTVLLFPGRTEPIEKYGRTAAALSRKGYASATLDWRGQGYSARDPLAGEAGHVDTFADYQLDVAALLDTVGNAGMPEPYYLLSHSMGGAIARRALAEGLQVRAAAFSAPMWGIVIAPRKRPFALGLSAAARAAGLGMRPVPEGRAGNYLMVTGFEQNELTHDPEMFDWMVRQVRHDPRLGLGRPTMNWLHGALTELRRLRRLPPVSIPTYVGIAGQDTIVDNGGIAPMSRGWSALTVEDFPDARHELLMEVPEVRGRFLDAVDQLFTEAG